MNRKIGRQNGSGNNSATRDNGNGSDKAKGSNCLIELMSEDDFALVAKMFDGKIKVSNTKIVEGLQRLDRRGHTFRQSRTVGSDKIELVVRDLGKKVYPVETFLDRIRERNTIGENSYAAAN